MGTANIPTTRFGPIDIEAEDVIRFPHGLPGLEGCTQWVLLADAQNDALGWLQSTNHPEVALAVVSPRRFVPDYHVRVARGDLGPLELEVLDDVSVVVIVSQGEDFLSLNLKAPVILNMKRRIGRQVVNAADQPIQYQISRETVPRKQVA